MLQAVWFDAGAQPGRLLLVAHHLVVDGVSWRILFDDLAAAWDGRRRSTRCPRRCAAFTRTSPSRRRRRTGSPSWRTGPRRSPPGADLRPRRPTRHGRRPRTPHVVDCPRRTPRRCCADAVSGDRRAARRAARRGHRGGRQRRGRPARRPGAARPRGRPRPVPHGRLVHQRRSRSGCPAGATHDRARSRELLARRAGPRHRLRHAAPPQRAVGAAARPLSAAQVLFNYLGRFRRAGTRTGRRRPRPTRSTCCPTRTWACPHVLALNACARETPDGPRLRATWTLGRRAHRGRRGARDRRRAGAAALARARRRALPRLLDQRPRRVRRPAGRGHLAAVAAAGGPVLPRRLRRRRGWTSTPRRTLRLRPPRRRRRGCARPCAALLRRNPSAAGRLHQRRAAAAGAVHRRRAPSCRSTVVDLSDARRPRSDARVGELMDADRPRRSTWPARRCAGCRDPARRRHATGWCSATTCCCGTAGRASWSCAAVRPVRARRRPTRDLPAAGLLPRLPGLARRAGRRRRAPRRWRAALAGLAEPTLLGPADRGREPVCPSAPDDRCRADAGDRLRAAARAARGHAQHVLNAALGAGARRRTTGRADVVFGTTVAGPPGRGGRHRRGRSACSSTPCRSGSRSTRHEPVADLLRRVQDRAGSR